MVRFQAELDARSLERIRLLAYELENLDRDVSGKLGADHEIAARIHAIRRRFLADLGGDKPEE